MARGTQNLCNPRACDRGAVARACDQVSTVRPGLYTSAKCYRRTVVFIGYFNTSYNQGREARSGNLVKPGIRGWHVSVHRQASIVLCTPPARHLSGRWQSSARQMAAGVRHASAKPGNQLGYLQNKPTWFLKGETSLVSELGLLSCDRPVE